MSGQLTVYISSTSANQEVKKQQQKIQMVLEGKKIPYKKVDVASDMDEREKMRAIVGSETANAPQIVNGETYCGNYESFLEAIENEILEEFLKLK